ncbi:MAG: flavodoxin family protein [Syntrophomonadaceae bacterium]|nr:flavodoxin family protein [Syntrophomonadaceae bacterium]MDD3022524.1 flavodoxin family protein [Syntrophomonadaceae bacterium]
MVSQLLVVGINGSPHVRGNTAFLLRQALEECKKLGAVTKLINCQQILKDQKNPFCMACASPCPGKCFKGKELSTAFELISKTDGLLLGSPVYFGTVSAQLKAFWDKGRSLRGEKKLLNVVGGALAVGASRFGGQETTIRAIHDMLLIQGMITVGDGYYQDDCGHMGGAAQRPAEGDDNAINRCRILGKRIFEVADATRKLRVR